MSKHTLSDVVRSVLLERSLAGLSEVQDYDLEGRSDWYSKSPAERRKIWSQGLTPAQRREVAHTVLDGLGLLPIVGEPADLANAALYASEGKYALAALSVISLIPVVGSAIKSALKSTQVVKGVPAKVIYEHADKIRAVMRKIKEEIPNGDKVSEAVEKILSDVRHGADGVLDTATGKVIKVAYQTAAQGAQIAASRGAKWYSNPEWKEWALSVIRPGLVRVLNSVSKRRLRKSLAKELVGPVTKIQYIRSVSRGPYGHLMTEENIKDWIADTLKRDRQIVKELSDNLDNILDDLQQNLRFRIITDPSEIPLVTTNKRALAHADPTTNEAVIFLPRFEQFLSDPERFANELVSVVSHEAYHILDSRLAAIFKKSDGKFLSRMTRLAGTADTILRNLDISRLSDDWYKSWASDPVELFVMVRQLRDLLKKADFSADDLKNFSKLSEDKLIKAGASTDLRILRQMMQGISGDSFEALAKAMNQVF